MPQVPDSQPQLAQASSKMDHRFAVSMEKTKLENADVPVNINLAFTITPAESKPPSCPSEPVVTRLMRFRSAADMKQFSWNSTFGFSECTLKNFGGRDYCTALPCKSVLPGQSITMTSSSDGQKNHWSDPANDPNSIDKSSVMVMNNTGWEQNVALQIYDPRHSSYWTSVVYPRLMNNGHVTVPSVLMLQAYVVDDEIKAGHVLRGEDLSRPLFTVPINCDQLPAVSKWKLSYDNNGSPQLKNDHHPELGQHSVVSLTRSLSEVKVQVDAILKFLGNFQDRLDLMEEKLAHTQKDVISGQLAIDEVHAQVLNVKEAAHTSALSVEAKTDMLAASFNLSQDSLLEGRSAIGETRELLSRMEDVADATRVQLLDFEQRLPVVEEKAAALAGSLDETREDVLNIRKSLQAVDDRVPAVEAKADRLERSVGQTRGVLSSLQKSFTSSKDQLGGLDTRVTAVEAKAEKLKESLDEMKEAETCDWPSLEDSPSSKPSQLPSLGLQHTFPPRSLEHTPASRKTGARLFARLSK